jgi:hypothetical protein
MKKAKIQPEHYSFTRYLETKANIDNRALNHRVWGKLLETLSKRDSLSILEIGAGIGTMLERLLSANIFQSASYIGIDISSENISYACAHFPIWARENGFHVNEAPNGRFHLVRSPQSVSVELKTADVLDYAMQEEHREGYDLLIAHAFMDLVDIPLLLPPLFGLLRREGLFYLTINYDALTVLEPLIADDLDRQVLELYHETMDKRLARGLPSGDSQTGRHLFEHIRNAGGHILEAGSSDWVVFAGENGYSEDEAYFLHFIIHTISLALQNHPRLNPQALEAWVNTRHAQIDSSQLVYIAHQLDFLGKK